MSNEIAGDSPTAGNDSKDYSPNKGSGGSSKLDDILKIFGIVVLVIGGLWGAVTGYKWVADDILEATNQSILTIKCKQEILHQKNLNLINATKYQIEYSNCSKESTK